MCYSALVSQNLKKLSRRFDAAIDYAQIELLFLQRLEGKGIDVARALEANFEDPQGEVEHRIKTLIDQYRSRITSGWEQELFRQKKRLGDAQRKLQIKETKTARKEERIATQKIQWHVDKINDLKRVTSMVSDSRVFPMWFVPVIIETMQGRLITPMRFHCRPAGKPKNYDERYEGLYNARRDSMQIFWREQFGTHHALCILSGGFYDYVERHRLEKRPLRDGEAVAKVELHFQPRDGADMLVPCVWSKWIGEGEEHLQSFAMITDDPPPEISEAGHDRCPINLRADNVDAWLDPRGRSADELFRILSEREQPYYEHHVLAA